LNFGSPDTVLRKDAKIRIRISTPPVSAWLSFHPSPRIAIRRLPGERKSPLDPIASTDRGHYCAAGDFHIDPWRPVPRAVIKHAQSDRARVGAEPVSRRSR